MKEIEEKKPSKILPILISVVGVIAIAAGLFLEVQDTNDKLVNGENNGKVSTVNYLVNDSTYADIVVEAKEEKTEKVTLKNPDKESNYQLYYTSDDDMTSVAVGYLEATKDSPSGKIEKNGTKEITVYIKNDGESQVTIHFGARGTTGSIDEIKFQEKEYKITNSIPQGGKTEVEGETELLNVVKQGDYVAYVGNNGCKNGSDDVSGNMEAESKDSCLGYNANEGTTAEGTYGYCSDSSSTFTVHGWRVAYIKEDRIYLISAGSPECNVREESVGNKDYIKKANEQAKKYCNSDYVEDCSNEEDIHAIGNEDFKEITAGLTESEGGYLYTPIEGAQACGDVYNQEVCGFKKDLISNGGLYWFAASYDDTDTSGVQWYPFDEVVNSYFGTSAYGLRPVIRLKAGLTTTGGTGTMEDPYQLS